MTPALSVAGLTVRYGDTVAVDDLDLVIPTGQTVALLGPNGAGKSTAINAVLGLLHPATGSVRVLGRRPRDAVRAGCVGAMLQHGGLPSEARVGEVLNLVRHSFPQAWPLDDLVATAGIDGLLGREVDALSGGQRQRVLLALALAGAPPLLLLDEPTVRHGRRGPPRLLDDDARPGRTRAHHRLRHPPPGRGRRRRRPRGRHRRRPARRRRHRRGDQGRRSGRTISFTARTRPRLDGLPARHRRRPARRHGHA